MVYGSLRLFLQKDEGSEAFFKAFSRAVATEGPPKALFDHPIFSSFLEAYPFPFYVKDADPR
jgi:hypothetical protein